ncbi:hypothetical protein [Paenibacillus sp. UMB4589-SE434]|uniref:hypothetical protein n=1 Tax=Paenibacillus sp. UMB4589-SE434 TaxID=3046314 RepID=UPI002549E5BE|nr:hypothetical protein [Paenibacillus sp. UMB4589-SE434]MDK8179551.1 hypothetical protein [Paenibacillus sp. UMB4589-SE434]
MYDFISICSDRLYSKKIRVNQLDEYIVTILQFTKKSNLIYIKEIDGEVIRIMGIPANSQGNYAFDSLDGIEEINLIEIAVPWSINDVLEKKITDLANAIAKDFSWMIDES